MSRLFSNMLGDHATCVFAGVLIGMALDHFHVIKLFS